MPSRPKLVLTSEKDDLFSRKRYPKPFSFNEDVAEVFDDMVERSIPLYSDVTRYTSLWAAQYYQPGSRIYDVGCSTGTGLLHLAESLAQGTNFIGIDNSQAMIAKARKKLKNFPEHHTLDLVCDDVMNMGFSGASVVIINYTLQFLPISHRQKLLANIYKGLMPGGILFLSEKVRFSCPEFQETTTAIYEEFKAGQGYSRTEIEKKKEALDQVLVPFTEKEHHESLSRAGFSQFECVMRWNNFMSIVAFKGY